MDHPKTFFLRTYGCQMNELDSELASGLLEKRGLKKIDEEDQADLIIYNTCSIRDLAERKVLGKLGLIGRKKKRALIGIMGCMVMTKKETLLEKFSHVDFLLGTNNVSHINEILDNVLDTKAQIAKIDKVCTDPIDYLQAKRENPYKAYVSINRGCNNFCSYCVVPFTRGREISRPPKDILQECQHLAQQGYKEVTLLGQNVNSYGLDQPTWHFLLPDLLEMLDKSANLQRIRFLTSNPHDITKELMQAMKDLPTVCEYLHFPLQAGSNRILKKMNRKYTKEKYLEKVFELKKLIPSIKIGTDIIVGFPTETDEEFQETYEAFEKVAFSQGFLFTYSPRKLTLAYRFPDDVDKLKKAERLQKLLSLLETIQKNYHQNMIGKTVEVLVDGQNKDGNVKGKTRTFDKVVFKADPSVLGTMQQVHIEDFSHDTLLGKLV